MANFFTETREVVYRKYGEERIEHETVVRKGRVTICIIAIVLAVIMLLSCTTVIKAGHTGVISTFGKINENVLQEGFNFKAPWQKIIKMDNRIVKMEVATEAFSSDLQTVSVNLAVNYRVDPNK